MAAPPPPPAAPVPAPAAGNEGANSGPNGGALITVQIEKRAKGFGFSTDNDGLVTGCGGAAEDAGVPVGSRIVKVNGGAVSSKADIVTQVRALDPSMKMVEFVMELPSDAQEEEPAPDDDDALMAI